MTPDGEETTALLRRLPGVRVFDLVLLDAGMRTPAMRRLRFGAEGLADLDAFAGQDLMIEVPAAGQAHFRRRYTIRSLDRDTPAVTLDVVLHGDGPGCAWAKSIRPGDRVEAIGPRGKIGLAPDADWHLFSGDEAALPAIFTMAEALPEGACAEILLEVTGAEEEQEPSGARSDLGVHWLHREGEAGAGTALQDAIAALPFPDGRGHAYAFGELRQVAGCRNALLARGLDASQIDHKAYWRRGTANAAHGEPQRPETASA
ncbi:MAG TPA: siderophore-interacting protein [Acidimicrobiales bacterium]|nr:siderophore-interacting protein [Acidimicrobiales bacterium]